jgi:hypothetical protein
MLLKCGIFADDKLTTFILADDVMTVLDAHPQSIKSLPSSPDTASRFGLLETFIHHEEYLLRFTLNHS